MSMCEMLALDVQVIPDSNIAGSWDSIRLSRDLHLLIQATQASPAHRLTGVFI